MAGDELRRRIEAVWRVESMRVLGGLMRLVRDVATAEDLAHDALVQAFEHWPSTGIPDNPGAWLMAAAKNRALDGLRRGERLRRVEANLTAGAEASHELSAPGEVDDDVLRLMLTACHPVLSAEARVALTLKLVAGLSTDEIGRAFLVPEPTVAQRLVRAKRTLAEARVPFEVPEGEALTARLTSLLEVIYLVFNEGYAATTGNEWIRPTLCHEAMRLGRVLTALIPRSAEVNGLVALMELQASRLPTRRGADGAPVLLAEQDRSRWDWLLIRRGLDALARAESLAQPLGPYTLQAAIAACHARATSFAETDWARIAALYDALLEVTQSPVVALNRAVALGMAEGPATGLEALDELESEPSLARYHLLPSARGELLSKLGRFDEARKAFERAAALASNPREQKVLSERAKALMHLHAV